MANKNLENSENSDNPNDGETSDLANRLLNGLTQEETAQLIDALFGVLSQELQDIAIAKLNPATQKTVRQILTPPSTITEDPTSETSVISLAKQAQTWCNLWQDWDVIIWEASQEEGQYIIQDAHWEPPYFHTTAFTENLEVVADKMLPLIQTAFDHDFIPDCSFIPVLLEVESQILNGLEEWIELPDGLPLGRQVTQCVLTWEWLLYCQQKQDAFNFAKKIRQSELEFSEITFDDDAMLNFLIQLPETDLENIFVGLTANRETLFWKEALNNLNSGWHKLYLDLLREYAPDRYVKNMRATIPQRWQNGLPVIEAFLAQNNYTESLIVIEETLQSLLKSDPVEWKPEKSLLVEYVDFYNRKDRSVYTLLCHYQETANGLHQTEQINALNIQKIAIYEGLNWSKMLNVFDKVEVSESTQKALFASWCNYINLQYDYDIWNRLRIVKTLDKWWVMWLIDSIKDPQKGADWFGKKMTEWMTNISGDQIKTGKNHEQLRLLTQDLTEIQNKGKSDYPKFYQEAIYRQKIYTQNDISRQEYLKQYAPNDLLEQVMNYWKTHLHYLIPQPELAQKSNYNQHARWMVALKEISPQNYKTIVAQWRVVHQRRSNLWKAMKEAGLSW
ncbi:MAG TPA: hypothetical protein DEG17_24300 [Cyanobacteria bacterium UBA11149]|nr:hypothetical protein [Cyanobacteria bacterium UBA11366]HBK63918.1 hypothetical protein [Cyanobacteria bacterium UBA11166]HBR76109.1 hypothetical protein [Cyanobacteria bacterium UBA11159]HBS68454.1 hypothetical protein [Cyanobacteria bacterium UBA11153]HBW91901.1 hypothetical protein [Cyanobacteria bacterium UBA11149]HCA93346.1 hypothetical protein [Cyanobacteria bacterium UBA9226]